MASSPSASRDASPELLTPRAKLQALLRSVDSSDEENTNPSATKRKLSYKAGLPRRASASPTQTHTSDDDSDVEIRPRGRLAARMQGAAPPSSATSGSTSKIPESSLPETARERVRRMLMQEEKENEADKGNADNDTTNEAHEEAEDDDEDLPVARRRLKRKSSVQPELASTQDETSVARSPSPSLFVSPAKPSPSKASEHAEDSDNDLPTLKSDRFKALVQRKRQEREAREAAEEARKAERRAQQEKLASEMEELDSDDGNVSSITDDEGGRQLTQKARPSRKASKKAIEDMNRETQRMQRNMQLAHEAKTRKKITKNSLFERFNFRPAGENEPKTTSSSRPGTPTSDAEMKDADTAPSSPPTARKDVTEDMIQQTPVQAGTELPSVDELALQTPTLDKGKGKAVDNEPQEELTVKPKRQVRVKMPAFANHISLDDSDDELQVTRTTKDKVKAVFDSVPLTKAKESHSLQALRALAQVKSPGQEKKRRSDHSGMTPAELQYNLQQRARQQARLERERRVEQLKAQGVVVQTAEEHEREKQEVENMLLAKAREEDRRLMQEERAAAKKKAREDGTADPLAWDDSEDEDYEERASKAGNDADAEQSAVELSGSEEEGDEEEEEEENEEEEDANPMFENEADEEAEHTAPETAVVLTDPLAVDEEELPSMNRRRGRNLKAVLSDDEDDVVEATPKPQKITHQSPAVPATDSPAAPGSVLRSAKKTFIPGLPVESGGPAGLGLTQIFAGTMDDSQSQMTPARGPTQSMMPDFDHFPDSNFSAKSERLIDESTQNEDTQTSTQGVRFNMTQSQMRRLDSLLQGPDTQISEMIEPSQDGGFQEHTPLHDRFVEPPTSTIQTVLLDRTASVTQAADSPLVQRGRLRRKLDVIHEGKDTESPSSATAFNALQDGAEKQKKKEQQDDFNRKKSKAKEMVQEQADESEDEYAGLGGADGEDSDDESTASVQEMIDDEAGNDADKAKIAAFYAERERMEDEQGMEKLYKDVTTGMLRRKRGMDYDLSDSDDGGEARRKMKRRQHAKMRQALYADERIEKIAKDPGNQAFLRTIEDQGSEDEMDIFDGTEDVEEEHSTATPPRNDFESQTVPDSQPRKALGEGGENPRAPAYLRRTKNGKKPADLGDVRKTLSNLLEDAEGSVIPATQAGEDSEEEEDEATNEVRQASFRSDKENDAPNPRRGRVAVVDRISLKRNSSSNMSASRLAFATTDSTGSGIKVPMFLHRASSAAGSNLSSTSSSPSTAAAGGGFGEEAKIKKPQGARGRSGIHGFGSARGAGAVAESEAMAKVRESERRRMEKRARGAERRMGAVGGLLGKGSFA
ncbi:MRC1-like domain-containing protein [Sarocladium implicatum]|nr:MRC1-like domain-containing protein [Sarocladium implicatum]